MTNVVNRSAVRSTGKKLQDRYYLDNSLYGIYLEGMLKWQQDAKKFYQITSSFAGNSQEIEKLIKSFPRKISKKAAVRVIEEIVSLLPFDYANCNPLESFCQRYSFYGEFGINHVFYLCIAPLLVAEESWQKEYSIKVNGPNDYVKLFNLLRQTENIVEARKEIEKAISELRSYEAGKEVFANELRKYLDGGDIEVDFRKYFPVILPYNRNGVGSREFIKKSLDSNTATYWEIINF